MKHTSKRIFTRNSQEDQILGQYNDKCLSDGVRLPTNRIVLQRFLHFRKSNGRLPTRDVSKILLCELKIIWQRAGIPIKNDSMCIKQLIALFEKWEKLKKISKPDIPSSIRHKVYFEDTMNRLCDLSPPNVYELLKSTRAHHWQEDWDFLQKQQRVPQIGYMSGVDKQTLELEERRAKRIRRKENSALTTTSMFKDVEAIEMETDNDEESSSKEDDSVEFVSSTPKSTRVNEVLLAIPTKN